MKINYGVLAQNSLKAFAVCECCEFISYFLLQAEKNEVLTHRRAQ